MDLAKQLKRLRLLKAKRFVLTPFFPGSEWMEKLRTHLLIGYSIYQIISLHSDLECQHSFCRGTPMLNKWEIHGNSIIQCRQHRRMSSCDTIVIHSLGMSRYVTVIALRAMSIFRPWPAAFVALHLAGQALSRSSAPAGIKKIQNHLEILPNIPQLSKQCGLGIRIAS